MLKNAGETLNLLHKYTLKTFQFVFDSCQNHDMHHIANYKNVVLPVVFTGHPLFNEAELILLGLSHGILSEFGVRASHHHRYFL